MEKVLKYSQNQHPDGFERIIILIIDFKFPDAPKSLRMQLVRSIIYRRNRLRYQQSHQSKLATERIDENEPVSPPKRYPAPSEQPHTDARQAPKLTSVAIRSDTEPTVFDMSTYRQFRGKPVQLAPTVKSSGSSDRVGEVAYPRPPALPLNSSHTECQFCSKEVSKADLKNRRWWRYAVLPLSHLIFPAFANIHALQVSCQY